MKILREIIVTTRPTLETEAYTIYTTYQTRDIPIATMITPVSEIAPDKEAKFREEFNARKGALWEKWVKERAKRLKQAIAKIRERKPEVVKV